MMSRDVQLQQKMVSYFIKIIFLDKKNLYNFIGRSSVGSVDTIDFYDSRQEPDGEESDFELMGNAGVGAANINNTNGQNYTLSASSHNVASSNFHQSLSTSSTLTDLSLNNSYSNEAAASSHMPTNVKVPNWVMIKHKLAVCFNDRAEAQLKELKTVDRQSIVSILEADPRSVYLRTKYGSQIFTFQLSEVTVTCKFDDKAGTVTVVQIRKTEHLQDDEVEP